MAVQKSKVSRARRGARRAHNALKKNKEAFQEYILFLGIILAENYSTCGNLE